MYGRWSRLVSLRHVSSSSSSTPLPPRLRSIYAWGSGSSGQLGCGLTQDERFPRRLETMTPDVRRLGCGSGHTVALVGKSSDIASASSSCRALTWGDNSRGQLGVGDTNTRTTPVSVPMPELVTDVACSHFCTMAVGVSGDVYMWGRYEKAIGKSSSDIVLEPTMFEPLRGKSVVRVAAGSEHFAAITSDGSLYLWGLEHAGRLGNKKFGMDFISEPFRVPIPLPVKDVSLGHAHSVALTEDGYVWVWGDNRHHQLGPIDAPFWPNPVCLSTSPSEVAGHLNRRVVDSICAGGHHTFCLAKGGGLICFGSAEKGQLGLGSEVSVQPIPIRISSLPSGEITSFDAGFLHSAVVLDETRLFTFGKQVRCVVYILTSSEWWQLGQGAQLDQHEPTIVSALDGMRIESVRCGFHSTFVVVSSLTSEAS